MIEILPIRLLTNEDAPIFGGLNVALANLARSGLSVGSGIAITPPNLKLKSTLEHFDFGSKEIFEQSLTLVKKEINSTPPPEILTRETGKHKKFLVNGKIVKSIKELWLELLGVWLDQIKQRLWQNGFYQGITEGLEVQVVVFVNRPEAYGRAYFDSLQDDVVINISEGKLPPADMKKIAEIIQAADKKLFIPHEYEWMVDKGVKLVKVLPYTPLVIPANAGIQLINPGSELDPRLRGDDKKSRSAVKMFLDMSGGQIVQDNMDGVYITSEKIFDLNIPRDSFEDLVSRLVEVAMIFPDSPILFKLADKSEGMGKVRGTLRLLHQKSLLEPMLESLDFVRHKKGLNNVHVVVPFVRAVSELLQIKRELAVKKLMRKNSLQIWMEVATPENIINLEEYLLAGLDGIVLNLDELIAHFSGFDYQEAELAFYKRHVFSLLKFLEDSLKLLHKSKKPFLALGSIVLYPEVLDFLVAKGVYGIVVERYEAFSIRDHLHQAEKRVVLRKTV